MSKDSEIKPPEISEVPVEKLSYLGPILTAASLVAVNALQRQFLANGRLGINNGESWGSAFERLFKSSETAFSGFSHRFVLQGLTQGVPLAFNRSHTNSSDADKKPKISSSLTALWMTAMGGVLEVSGLGPPIKDKARSDGKGEINYFRRAPVVAACTVPFMYGRNLAYAQLVFGQSDKDLPKKLAVASVGAVLTNPLDAAINVAAYEAAIAKDGTPVADIFCATWQHFMEIEKGASPYQNLTRIMSKCFSGAPLRVAGVGGAALIFSKPVADAVQEGFENYIAKSQELWSRFQSKIVEHGGVDLPKESKVDTPSTAVQILNHEQLEKGGSRETEA